MLKEIEELSDEYYPINKINPVLYGHIMNAKIYKKINFRCIPFISEELYEKYKTYLRKFIQIRIPGCYVSWDEYRFTVAMRSFNYLSISNPLGISYSV